MAGIGKHESLGSSAGSSQLILMSYGSPFICMPNLKMAQLGLNSVGAVVTCFGRGRLKTSADSHNHQISHAISHAISHEISGAQASSSILGAR